MCAGLRGSVEVHTAQSQPSVGTPIEVPVPRKVRVASIASGRMLGPPGPGRPGATGCFGCSGAGEGLRDLKECHTQLEQGAVEQASLFRGEVAFGFFFEHSQHVDALARSEDIDLGLLALLGGAAELHDGGHVDRLHELLEAHRRWGDPYPDWRSGWRCRAGRPSSRRRALPAGFVRRWGLVGARVPLEPLTAGPLRLLVRLAEVALRSSLSGDGSASGRNSPSMVNLRRSVTTKGLFCSGMITLFQKFQMLPSARRLQWAKRGSETGCAVPPV